MAVVLILALVVGLYLLRRFAKGGKTTLMVTPAKPYNPNRAQFQRVPGRRRNTRGL